MDFRSDTCACQQVTGSNVIHVQAKFDSFFLYFVFRMSATAKRAPWTEETRGLNSREWYQTLAYEMATEADPVQRPNALSLVFEFCAVRPHIQIRS